MLSSLLLSALLTTQSPALVNGDFEAPVPAGQPPPGWILELGATLEGAEPRSVVELDTQVKHGGQASIRFTGNEATRGWYVLKQDVPVRPTGLYTLSAFAKAQGVRSELLRGTQTEQFKNAYVAILFLDWAGEMIAEVHQMPKLPSGDWEELKMYSIAPEKTRRVQIALFLSMSGSFWVDDLTFSLEGGKEPPAPKVLLREGFEALEALPMDWNREIGARTGNGAKATVIEIDKDVADGDSPRSLKFTGDATTNHWIGIARRFEVAPGEGLTFRARVKTKDVRREGTQPGTFYTGIVFVGGDGKMLGAKRNTNLAPGTYDWIDVVASGAAPDGTVAALVGIFYAMSGEVWFDRLELTSQTGATPAYAGWETLETDRTTLRYPPDHPEKERMEYYGTRLDTAFETIHKRLGLAYGDKIAVYVYADAEQGRKMTNRELDFSNPQARVVHQRYDSQPGHEMTHVIAFAMGLPGSDLFNEGLAVYFEGTPAKDLHLRAASLLNQAKLPTIASLTDHYHGNPEVNAAAGSFCGFLIETLGLETFKRLYLTSDIGNGAGQIVDGGLPELEKRWHEFLRKQS